MLNRTHGGVRWLALSIPVLVMVVIVFAPVAYAQLPGAKEPAGTTGDGIDTVVNRGLQTITDLLAMIGVGLIVIVLIWGGIRYMTAGGDPQASEGAQKILLNGVIGGAILVLTSVIVGLIFNLNTLFT